MIIRSSISRAAIRPSARGELEITDINRAYLARGQLHVEMMGRGYAWLDTGTHASLIEASQFVQIVESGKVCESLVRKRLPFAKALLQLKNCFAAASAYHKSSYGRYLRTIYETEVRAKFG